MRGSSGAPRTCRKAIPRSRGLLPIAEGVIAPPPDKNYTGRFAPSPTGQLHIGSLVMALASFLHARQNGGQWFVRIEDIDPPREQAGAADSILRTLEGLDLSWDGEPVRQSGRLSYFEDAARHLLVTGAAFRCTCSRRAIRLLSPGGRYPGTCRKRNISREDAAIRVTAPDLPVRFRDELQGEQIVDIGETEGDYVIYRRDGLPAYHLAVVLDDAASGVSDIVRGIDLLEQTAIHRHLQSLLHLPSPRYWHLPVVTDVRGAKLSKQTGAAGIGPRDDLAGIALAALRLLDLEPPRELTGARPGVLWDWAQTEWRIERHRGQRSIPLNRNG